MTKIVIPLEYRKLQARFKVLLRDFRRELKSQDFPFSEIRKRVTMLDAFLSAYDFRRTLIVTHQDGSCLTLTHAKWEVLQTPKHSLLAIWTEHIGSFVLNLDDLHDYNGCS